MMSYKTNEDLPISVRDRLSESAQDLYRAAFNSALDWYGEPSRAALSLGARSEVKPQVSTVPSANP